MFIYALALFIHVLAFMYLNILLQKKNCADHMVTPVAFVKPVQFIQSLQPTQPTQPKQFVQFSQSSQSLQSTQYLQ